LILQVGLEVLATLVLLAVLAQLVTQASLEQLDYRDYRAQLGCQDLVGQWGRLGLLVQQVCTDVFSYGGHQYQSMNQSV